MRQKLPVEERRVHAIRRPLRPATDVLKQRELGAGSLWQHDWFKLSSFVAPHIRGPTKEAKRVLTVDRGNEVR